MRTFKVTAQQVKRKYNKKQNTTNYLFFITKNIISRRQILQVTNMRYDTRPTESASTFPKLTIETQKQGVKYAQS